LLTLLDEELLDEELLVAALLLPLDGALLTLLDDELLDEELLFASLLLFLEGAWLTLLDEELLEPTLFPLLDGAWLADRFEVLRCGLLYVWALRVAVRLRGFSVTVLWVTEFRSGERAVVDRCVTLLLLRVLLERVALLLLVL